MIYHFTAYTIHSIMFRVHGIYNFVLHSSLDPLQSKALMDDETSEKGQVQSAAKVTRQQPTPRSQ